jgi:aminopeptidase
MEFDVELVADKTIEMLSVSKGQVIWIWASTVSLKLIEALAFRIRARGAFWTLRLTSEELLQRIGLNAPEENLAQTPQHELRWLADVSAIIEVRDHGGDLAGVALPRRRAMAAEWIALIDEANRCGCRRITVLNPTPALAAAYGIPLEKLKQLYQRAIQIDDGELDKWQARVSETLAKSDAIRIMSDAGTDLKLRIGGRPIFQDKDNLPRGEVYVAPIENSANGTAVIDRMFIKGKPVERLRLTFSEGRVTGVKAPDPADAGAFQEILASTSGDRDVIAEFAIGLNPGVTETIGNSLFDEKIGGTIHIAIGMNRHFGGANQSNLHLDMVMQHPKVWIDDNMVLDNGLLKIGGEKLQFEEVL